MPLGYDGQLFILAFDHRGSFKKKFGVGNDATTEQMLQLQGAKSLVFAGFEKAAARLDTPGIGVLVDEEMGTDVARAAKDRGFILAMPVEKSGQDVFDFEYGNDFGKHIEDFDPDFSKVLVRWNPGDDDDVKQAQGERLARLGNWLHDNDRKFLFELLVPASDADMARVDGDQGRYDTEVRPGLTVACIEEIQAAGVEPDIWKIEGLDDRADCERLATAIRADGRDGVIAIVLGRGADNNAVDHWLRTGASVDGYRGFAIGRSIWTGGVDGWSQGAMSHNDAAEAIAANFKRFVDVYTSAT